MPSKRWHGILHVACAGVFRLRERRQLRGKTRSTGLSHFAAVAQGGRVCPTPLCAWGLEKLTVCRLGRSSTRL